jgi:hypothetical protein
MDRTSELPTKGAPNSSRERLNDDGEIIQRRFYGGDGNAIINIDYDHDHGAGKPHAHDWDWSEGGGNRLPGRPLTANEKRKAK